MNHFIHTKDTAKYCFLDLIQGGETLSFRTGRGNKAAIMSSLTTSHVAHAARTMARTMRSPIAIRLTLRSGLPLSSWKLKISRNCRRTALTAKPLSLQKTACLSLLIATPLSISSFILGKKSLNFNTFEKDLVALERVKIEIKL